MRVEKAGVDCQCLAQLLLRFIVAPREIESDAEVCVDNRGKRIQFDGAPPFGDGFFESAKANERVIAIPLVGGGVIRV